jgi:HK97 family phage prohead protease
MLDELDFRFDAKALEDDGAIEGLAVGYGNIDHGGDLVLPGALDLAGKSSLPMLLFHDQKRPVGVWNDFRESAEGLHVKGRFSMSTLSGKEAHALVRDGALTGLSMGYVTRQQRFQGKSRQIVKAELHEVSLVTVPMNDRTRITRVKDILDGGEMPTVRQFEELLREAGFSKTLAAAIATKAAPCLRGDPDGTANDARDAMQRLRDALA